MSQCGGFPPMPHVPFDTRCEVDKHVIHPVVPKDVPIIEINPHEDIYGSSSLLGESSQGQQKEQTGQ